MKLYFRKNGIKVAIVVLIVAIFVVLGAYLNGDNLSLSSNAIGAIRAPIQRSVGSISGWLEGLYGYIYKYDQLMADNNALRKQLADAQEQLRYAQEATEENTHLRELLNLQKKHKDFTFVSAKIISWEASNYTSTFTISKGKSSDLEVGQPVVTEYGALAGEIIELGDSWATVRTIIDIDMDVGALVGDAGSAAIVEGDFALMRLGQTKLSYLADGKMSSGETIFTSGKGGKFPQGLEIGNISSVETEAGGQLSYGIVDPSVDLSALSQVFVIKDFEITE